MKEFGLMILVFLTAFMSTSLSFSGVEAAEASEEHVFNVNADLLLQEYNYLSSLNVLNSSKSLTKVPYVQVVEYGEEYELLSEIEVQQFNLNKVKQIFYNTQLTFFDSPLIDLDFCFFECGFSAEYQDHKVLFQVDLVKQIVNDSQYENYEDVIRYISAHEISHYIHEFSAHPPYSKEDGHSIHGNPSVYQDFFGSAMDSLSPEDKAQVESGNGQHIIDGIAQGYFHGYLKSHAEVDMFATLNLHRSGFNGWNDVFKFIDGLIENEPADVAADFINRKRVIKKVIEENKK